MAFTIKHGVMFIVAVVTGLVLYYGGAGWATRKFQELKPKEIIVYKPDPQQEKTLRTLEDERRELLKKEIDYHAKINNLNSEILTLKVQVEQEKSQRKVAETRVRELEQAVVMANRDDRPDPVNINVNEPDHEMREIVRNQGLKGFSKKLNALWVVDEWFPAAEFKWPPVGMKGNLEVNGEVLATKGDDVTLIRVKYRVAGRGAFDQDCYVKNGVFFAYFDRTSKSLNLVPR